MLDTSQPVPNEWSATKSKEASENYNLVMNRTWYGIAGTLPEQGKMELFWEYNYWVPGKEGQKFNNHTVTRDVGVVKIKDYGTWNGFLVDGFFSLRPTLTILGIRIPLPAKIVTHWLTFPKGDSLDQVWTYYGDARGKRIVFIWSLTPHLSEDVYTAELDRLKEKNGIDVPFYKIQWPTSYKPGDTGEHKIN